MPESTPSPAYVAISRRYAAILAKNLQGLSDPAFDHFATLAERLIAAERERRFTETGD
jgi:hypothetical protein